MRMYFVHIPKTAGTSFRKAAEAALPDTEILYDYDADSPITSGLISNLVYTKKDTFMLKRHIFKHKNLFLSGHFGYTKYKGIFSSSNVITFLRKPAEQVISHYEHYVRNNNYKNNIEAFYKSDQFTNLQTRLLTGTPIEMYGFVGITEEYDKSIELFNYIYDTELEPMVLNTNPKKKTENYNISQNDYNEINKLNYKDNDLYANALKLFNTRYDLYKNKLPFTYCKIELLERNLLSGWAFRLNSSKPLFIHVYRNDKLVAAVKATDFRPGLMQFFPPRDSFIGFGFKFPKKLQTGEVLVCKLADTEQEVFNHTV